MHRNILIALVLLLATVGGVFADDDDKLKGKLGIQYLAASSGPLSDADFASYNDGKAITVAFTINLDYLVQYEEHYEGKLPVKYRVSWTNQTFLSWKQPNPEHGRRGNLFLDHSTAPETVYGVYQRFVVNMTAVPGKTLRLRVRAIYADKVRDECIVTLALQDDYRNTEIWNPRLQGENPNC